MRKLNTLLGLSCLAVAGLTAQVNAAPITHNIAFGATVEGSCSIGGSATVISGTAFSGQTLQNSTFTIGVTGATANATSGELSIGTITCNSGSMKVTLTPNGWIKRASGPGEITYSVYVKNGTTDLNSGNAIISSGIGTGPKDVTVNSGTLNLRVLINTNAATNLAAGAYTGILALSIDAL